MNKYQKIAFDAPCRYAEETKDERYHHAWRLGKLGAVVVLTANLGKE